MRGLNGPGALFPCPRNDFSIRVRYFNIIFFSCKGRGNNMKSDRFAQISY